MILAQNHQLLLSGNNKKGANFAVFVRKKE